MSPLDAALLKRAPGRNRTPVCGLADSEAMGQSWGVHPLDKARTGNSIEPCFVKTAKTAKTARVPPLAVLIRREPL